MSKPSCQFDEYYAENALLLVPNLAMRSTVTIIWKSFENLILLYFLRIQGHFAYEI